jgi:two-component system cell cycle response regulator
LDSGEDTRAIDRKEYAPLKQEPRSACFVVIAGKQTGTMYKLEKGEALIGRSENVSLLIDDDGVSRHHAKVVRQPDGTLAIVDLRSTNGTFCNGERVQTRVLKDGDKIQIGTTTIIKFSFQDSLEEEFLRHQYDSATRDPLMHCYNKRFFLDRLPGELAFAKRHNKPLSLAMIDIDHFKKINDSYGHPAGDLVLRMLGSVLQNRLRAEDIFVRYGGEEFALIMRETPAPKALLAAERIRSLVADTVFIYEKREIRVTVSIGIATWPAEDIDSMHDLIKAADANLYRAKHAGRNRTAGS